MLLVVGVVALMVMLFSIGYMDGEDGFPRYFALLSLFTAADDAARDREGSSVCSSAGSSSAHAPTC